MVLLAFSALFQYVITKGFTRDSLAILKRVLGQYEQDSSN